MRILVVEDEELKRMVLVDALSAEGHDVRGLGDGSEAQGLIGKEPWDLVLTDIKLPGTDGLTILETTRRVRPEASVIVMTAYGTIDTAVEAMRRGAHDFLTKPFTPDELLVRIQRLTEYRDKVEENTVLRRALGTDGEFHGLVGRSRAMRGLFEQVRALADSNAAVLVVGETGTGKELLAEAIHFCSRRAREPLIKVSCVTLSENIIESELFGHERGAFSGAIRTRPGRFELAARGTIFLDDVDDIPLSIQPKLLRVLQNREFERVGGERTIRADARVVAATKKDLGELTANGKFREDLYYRLRTVLLRLPPLRERKEEIPQLVEHFCTKFDRTGVRTFAPETLKALARHDWPGNVRELEHLVEATLALTREPIVLVEHLPHDFLERIPLRAGAAGLKEELMAVERDTITRALARFDGNVSETARHLGIARGTLRDRLKKLGIGTD